MQINKTNDVFIIGHCSSNILSLKRAEISCDCDDAREIIPISLFLLCGIGMESQHFSPINFKEDIDYLKIYHFI